MKPLALILAFAAVTSAQKPLKASKHKPAYIAHSPGGGAEAAPQYQQQAPQHPAISNHGGFGGSSGGHHGGGGGGSYSSGIGKGDSKRIFPQLLSDTRTLNPDGTINFDYKADNGLHQGESVDSDGTRRGFYSYPGADGKLITVKYTAGKNGFVAEGPHLPTQPQSANHNPKQDDIYSSGKQGSNFGGLGGGHFAQGSPQHHGGGGNQGAYRPSHGLGGGNHGQQASHYSHSSGLGGGSGGGGGGGAASFANFPDFSSHFPSSSSGGKHGHGFGSGDSSSFTGFSAPRSLNAPNHHFILSHPQPQAQTQINNVIGSPSYSSGSAGGAGAGRYSGGGGGAGGHHGLSAHPGGSSSFSSLGGLGGLGGGHGGSGASLADIQSSLGQQQYSGPMFTANNPYQPSLESANPANPVNAGFDLGNGGHFAINFTPGQAQEYNVNDVGDFGSQGGQGGHGGQVTNYGGGGSSGQGGGAQGRY